VEQKMKQVKVSSPGPEVSDGGLDANLRIVRPISAIAESRRVAASQVAIAWTITQGRMPIPGIRRVRYIEEDVAAADTTHA
jgi:aryl-alcohol dehydrogenase-like predicted oxidoreductase